MEERVAPTPAKTTTGNCDQLSLDQDTTLQALGVEALERILEERQR